MTDDIKAEFRGMQLLRTIRCRERLEDGVAFSFGFKRDAEGRVDIEVGGSMVMQDMIDATERLWKYFEDHPDRSPFKEPLKGPYLRKQPEVRK